MRPVRVVRRGNGQVPGLHRQEKLLKQLGNELFSIVTWSVIFALNRQHEGEN